MPLVSVIAALTLISSPAHIVIFPSVAVRAAATFKFTLRPVLNKTLPLTVVMALLTLMSRPQHTTKFPLVAETALFTFTSRMAFNVRVVGFGVAVQLTASFTLMSPFVPVVPWLVQKEPRHFSE